MTDESIPTIARTISPATELALLAASECKGGDLWTPYPVCDTRLARYGVLTQLGEDLRAHLQQVPATPAP